MNASVPNSPTASRSQARSPCRLPAPCGPGPGPRTGRVQCDNAERAQIERIIPRDMSVLNFDTAAHRKGIGQLVGNGRIDVDCLQ